VVFSSEPPISISLLSLNIINPPHPPGPGIPLQAPSVAASIAYFVDYS